MANLDAVALAEKALRLGLLNLDQLQEGWQEVGQRAGEADPLIRALERKGYLTPWQSQKLLKDDPDGFFLGGYRILYKIASGSFGRVYRADEPHTGRVVAIKILRRKWSEDKHQVDLFEREGKMGMSLRHPNIVEIIAVNRDLVSHQYYIVMEFVEGGNLRDLLTIRKRLEPAEALRILDDATAGLAYAYSHGVNHRDMKLTNVLISTQGAAKLVDFGLAGVYGKAQTNESGAIVVERTVDYAGLEKATDVAAGDIRSDIYFLGCVAYEMMCGRAPLDMTRDPRRRMSRERFLNVQAMGPDDMTGPPSLFRLVETMMSFNPQQRFQTPSQLLDAIRDVRRELEGKSARGAASTPNTLFVVEKDESLQDLLRNKFKEAGFRVLLAADPVRAIERFRQQPFDVLVLDGRTTGEDGVLTFERIMDDAVRHRVACAGIVMLGEDQADLASKVTERPMVAVLTHPTFKQLLHKVEQFLAARKQGS